VADRSQLDLGNYLRISSIASALRWWKLHRDRADPNGLSIAMWRVLAALSNAASSARSTSST